MKKVVMVKQQGPNVVTLLLSSVFHYILFSCFPVVAFCPAVLSHQATEPCATLERGPVSGVILGLERCDLPVAL